MIIRAMGILAVLLAAGCALEQGDDPVVGAPDTHTSTGSAAGPAVGVQTPSTGESNHALGGSGTQKEIPSTQSEPCDPDPQPWKPACPLGPGNGAATIARDHVPMTPPQN